MQAASFFWQRINTMHPHSPVAHPGQRRKAPRTTPRTAGTSDRPISLARLAVLAFTLQAWLLGQVQAQIIADPSAPKSQQAVILPTANGLPQVNIQTPSAAGVSRNTYSQFDVQKSGAILNNSRTNVQTQLGGWIQANPYLATGSARVILNEVNSSNPSQLKGYVEVAGDRAQVVIANPSGVSCDGCGFINANRVTLTTGTAIINGGSLDGYLVRGGTVTVQGAGMDASQADYTDIIARAVQVNAGIWAKELHVTTGANQVSADNSQITPTSGTGSAPSFSIDVAQLGGMYANKIILVGTEAGVGMRNGGTLAASGGDLVLQTNGWLSNSGSLQASANVQITTQGDFTNSGSTYAGSDQTINVAGQVNNSGFLAAQGNSTISATSLSSSGQLGAGVNASGSLTGSGNLNVSTSQVLAANGQNLAAGNLSFNAASVDVSNSQTNAANIALTAASGDVNTSSASVTTAGTLSISANGNNAQSLNNTQGNLNAGQLTLALANLNNTQGQIVQSGTGDTSISLSSPSGVLNNTNGTIAANSGNLSLSAATLTNTNGNIKHAGSGTLSMSAGTLNNTQGQIASNAAVQLQLGSLSNNAGSIYASTDLNLTGTSLVNGSGAIAAQGNTTISTASLSSSTGSLLGAGVKADGSMSSSGNLNINASQSLSANGQNLAAGNLSLNAASVDVSSSQTNAANIALTATTGDVTTASASVTTAGTLSVNANSNNAQSLNNTQGSINAGQLTLTVANLNNTHGQILQSGTGDTSINLSSPTGVLNNSNGTIAVNSGNLSLAAGSITNTNGTLQFSGSGNLGIATTTLSNQGGQILQTGTGATTVTVAQTLNNSNGMIASNGSSTLSAQSISNDAGRLSAAGSLGATATNGALSNRQGTISANNDITLTASSVDNTQGTAASVSGSLSITSSGTTLNDGGTLQAALDVGLNNAGLSNGQAAGTVASNPASYGSISGATLHLNSNGQTLNNNGGTLAASQAATLQSGAFNNVGGLLQSGGDLNITSASLTNTNATAYLSSNAQLNGQGGIAAQGNTTINTGTWTNDSGYLGSKGILKATVSGMTNAAGQVQSVGDLNIAADSGSIDNSSGLIRSAGTATLSAASLTNSNTSGANLGIEGQNIAINAANIINDNGAMRANAQLSLTSSGTLSNLSALMSAGNTLTLQDSRTAGSRTLAIKNAGGTLLASRLLSVAASSLSGSGQVLSQADLNLSLQGDVSNSGQLIANGNASISTNGNFSNSGTLSAGNTLSLTAANIDNAASGELSATQTQLTTSGTLTNRGLIDGSTTIINAGTVNNLGSGRIYGDNLSISATNLTNDTETVNGVTQAGTIAARNRLDLGISGTLTNREHALIYSAGDMAIGGSLDGSNHASGQAGTVNNSSATIEASGALSLSSAVLNNTNNHLSYQVVQDQSIAVHDFVQDGGQVIAGTDVNFVLNYPSPSYNMGNGHLIPVSAGITAAQKSYYFGPDAFIPSVCNDSGDNQTCTDAVANVALTDPMWAYFNIAPPTSTSPVCQNDGCAWEPAWTALQSQLNALRATINADAVVFSVWRDYTETSYKAQVTSTDPGRIASGGAMTLNAGSQLLNDNSNILAGGALNITGTAVNNQALQVTTNTVRNGNSHDYAIVGEDCGGWFSGCSDIWQNRTFAYNTAQPVTVNLSVSQSAGNTAFGGGSSVATRSNVSTNASIAGTGTASSRNGAILEFNVSVPTASGTSPSGAGNAGSVSNGALATSSGFIVRTSNQAIQLPTASLFQIKPAPGASYLIATDPRFTNQQQWLSSSYLTQSLTLDPSVTQKRLGDGYYEQRLVSQQVAQLTGRRFLDNYTSDAAQYQALMDNAITFAKQTNLQPGIALSAQQVAQLTSDIVWLVQQTVTLPDGTTQNVLVPQLYVRTQPGDLNGSGSLLTGSSVNLNLSGDLSNSGQIAGRQVVQLSANNVSNLGSISGDSVTVAAQQDLNNSGSINAVSSLTALAGRDMTLASSVQSSNNGTAQLQSIGRVAGLYVTGASGTLQAEAGRDLNLSAAVIANNGTGATVLAAGRDLNLASVQTQDMTIGNKDAQNYLSYGSQSETGSQVSGGGAVQLSAGNDINARAATVQASGALSASAGNDLNISAGQSSQSYAQGYHADGSGFMQSASVTSRTSQNSTQALASSFSGDTVNLQAGQNLAITGSSVVSTNATQLTAGGSITIAAATETAAQSSLHEEQRSGLSLGGMSSSASKDSYDATAITQSQSGSAVGSLNGNANITAGKDITVQGSSVVGLTNVALTATNGNVAIVSSQDSSQISSSHEQSASSFSLGYSAGVASTGYSQASASNQTSSSTLTQQSSTIAAANGNAQIQAGQALSVVASDISAGQNLTLIGKSVDLSAAQNTSEQQGTQQSSASGFSVGVTVNPVAAFQDAFQHSASGNPSTSLLGKSTKYGDAFSDGAQAATTAAVLQAGSHSANSSQSQALSTAQVSSLTAGNNLTILATGGSITSQGANMSAEGDATLIARDNILLDVAHSTQSQGQTNTAQGLSLDNRSAMAAGVLNNTGNGNGSTDTISGTSLSAGGKATLATTGGNITLTAANLVASGDLNINAANKLTIQSGQDLVSNANQSNNQAVGKVVISDTERFSGYHTENSQNNNNTVTQVGSNVASLQGNVTLTAGDSYTQTASNVLAANNIDISAKSIDISTADNSGSNAQNSDSLKIGAFARISSPLIDLANNIENAKKSDGRLQAMQTMAAAANAYQAYSGLTKTSGSIVKAEVGVGFASANSADNTSYVQAQGSTIQGGGNVSLSSTTGDIQASGAQIGAGNTLTLDSARNILLQASQSTIASNGDNHNAGAEIGVGASVGAQTGVYVYATASIGSGEYKYNAATNSNTQLSGNTVSLTSQNDTTLKGASVKANTINANVGGTLAIESLQDIITQSSQQNSVGGRVQISIGTAWEASGNMSQSSANGSSAIVTAQSGLFAGDGGYHVTANSVALKGGAIASSNAANSDLTAQSISFENLTNKMDYAASTMSVSGGYSSSNSSSNSGNSSNSGSQSGADGSNSTAVTQTADSGQKSVGPSLTPGIILQDSGSASSTTYATLTEGKITIGGQTTSAAALGAHTDLATANSSIEALPDVKKLMQDQQAMAAAANTVVTTSVQVAGDIASSRAKAAQASGDTEAAQNWSPTGDYTRALKTIAGVLVGGLAGQSAGQLAAGASAPYLANAIGDYFSQPGNENKTAQVLSHAVLGALLAAANGGSAAGGAAAGAGGELAAEAITKELYPKAYDADGSFHPDRLSASEANTVVALSSAVGAMLGGVTGGTTQNALIGANVAANAATNNYLTHSTMNIVKSCLLGLTCSSDEEKKEMIANAEAKSKELDAEMKSLCSDNSGSDACKSAVNAATQYVAMKDAWNFMNGDVKRSSTDLFENIYNSPDAKVNFTAYYNTIDNRADFFAATNQYEKNIGSGTKWFGGADYVSRALLTGLGADGYASWFTFFAGSTLAGVNATDIYTWRSTAGNALMSSGFSNFKNLYNNGATDPVAWDIAQLKNEQKTLQPIHEQFLSNLSLFTDMSKFATNTDYFGVVGGNGISGGVDILDYKSRIEYGCKLLGYGEKQGCAP